MDSRLITSKLLAYKVFFNLFFYCHQGLFEIKYSATKTAHEIINKDYLTFLDKMQLLTYLSKKKSSLECSMNLFRFEKKS